MKCLILFSRKKNRKNITNLSSAECTLSVISVKCIVEGKIYSQHPAQSPSLPPVKFQTILPFFWLGMFYNICFHVTCLVSSAFTYRKKRRTRSTQYSQY